MKPEVVNRAVELNPVNFIELIEAAEKEVSDQVKILDLITIESN